MKILLAQNTTWVPTLGGASKGNRLLLEELAARGHRVVAVAPAVGLQVSVADRTAFRAALSARGLEAEDLGGGADRFALRGVEVRAVHDASRLPQVVAETIRELTPDRVLMSSEDTGQILLEAALEAAPERVVYLARTTWNLPFGPAAYLPSPERAAMLRRCLGAASISRFLCRYMERWGSLEAELLRLPVLTLGDGPFADHGRYRASGEPGDEGFIVHINPCAVKGLPLLLACADALPQLPFAAVPTWGTTAEDRRELERRPNITVLEPRDSIDDIFRRCRAVLMPSLWAEAYGRTTVEAMLRGLPVLASNVGGLPEAKIGVDYLLPVAAIEGYSNRFDDRNLPVAVVPPQDPAPWIGALRDLFSSEDRYRQVAAEGRKAAERLRRETSFDAFVRWLETVGEGRSDRAAGQRRLETADGAADGTAEGATAAAITAASTTAASTTAASATAGSLPTPPVGLSRERRALLALRALRKRRQAEAEAPSTAPGGTASSFAKAAVSTTVGGTVRGSRRIPLASRDTPLPLSFAQRRVWFFERWERGSAAFHIPLAARFQGRLVLPWLEAAVSHIVARHEVLRSRIFDSSDGVGVQEATSPRRQRCPVVDLSGLVPAGVSPSALEALSGRLAAAAARRPFDLATGQLSRLLALRLEPRDHRVVWVIHHIAADGWSLGVLLREMAVLYQALHDRSGEQGVEGVLPALEIQYADFAAWQWDQLQGEVLERQLTFWRQHLEGAPPLLELPFDRPRGAVESFHGSKVPLRIDSTVTAAVQRLAETAGTTLFAVLAVAFAQLLSRASGRRDLVLGTLVANRRAPQTQALVGYFVNSLPLRLTLRSGDTAAAALARLGRPLVEALDHQELPFERLVEELSPQRQVAHHPLFQVMVALQNAPTQALRLPEVEVHPQEADRGAAHVDLFLSLGHRAGEGGGEGDRLDGFLEYSTDLFDATTALRMARRLERLLGSLAKHPDQPLEHLSTQSPAQLHQLCWEWGPGSGRQWPAPSMLAELAARAQDSGDAAALEQVGSSEPWSRRRLLAAAVELAARLRHHGVAPGEVVALETLRRPETLAAMLGILGAGAAWTPVAQDDPPARRRRAVKDAGARWLVSAAAGSAEQQQGSRSLAAELGLRALSAPRGVHAGATAIPTTSADGQSPAYLLYTSGSTGHPKGVMVPRRALDHYVAAAARFYRLTAADRVLQFCSLSFDTSVEEIFPTLAVGATLVLRSPEMLDPRQLLREVRRRRITVVSLPTAFWHQLASLPAEEMAPWPTTLRLVIIGGERARADRLEAWNRGVTSLTEAPPELVNTYGPTEATVVAVGGRAEVAAGGSGEIPLGRSLPSTAVYITDGSGQLQPLGVPGELHIGGAGVTTGYRYRPAETAGHFIPDVFSQRPGARLYATGDRARWRADGRLEFLGRVDQQVKIRGYRVEPGEVEAALGTLPSVAQGVVTVHGGEEDDAPRRGPWLAAHVVLEAGDQQGGSVEGEVRPDGEALRRRLAEILPDHLVPVVVTLLDRLPTTVTGKIDRAALEAPSRDLDDMPAGGGRALEGPAEHLVAQLFGEVLEREPATAAVSFFDLGGHSLSAMQLAARLRSATGADIELREIFEAPTVAGVAAVVSSALARTPEGADHRRASEPVMPRPRRGADAGAPPLSFAQERLWFLDQLEPGSAAYNLPSALLLRGHLDPARLDRCFQLVLERHEVLRTAFGAHDGRPRQQVLAAVPFQLQRLDLSQVRDADTALRRLAARDALRPFDLSRPPLLRATLVALPSTPGGEPRWAMLFVMHHIVSDGWSMALLVRELTVLYEGLTQAAAAQEAPVSLPPLQVQYGDYALWQRRRLEGELREQQLEYWRQQLGEAPEPLDLPGRAGSEFSVGATQAGDGTSGDGTSGDGNSGDTVWLELPRPLTEAARAFARRHRATLFMVLLAAFNALLLRLSGRRDLAVGVPVAHRQRPELEDLVGFFVNTLVLRLEVAPDGGLGDLVHAVRDTALAAWAHQDVPFEQLVAEINPDRDLGRSPLFQVMFALQDAPVQRMELPGLTIEPLPMASGSARFELFLELVERSDGSIGGGFHFARALFDRQQVARMAQQLEALLAAALDTALGTPVDGALAGAPHPDGPSPSLQDLSWLPAAQRHQLLVEWSDSEAPYPRDATLWPLLAKRAAATPEAPAAQVRYGAQEAQETLETWNYGELVRIADGLATALATACAAGGAPLGPGVVVPVLGQRGLPFLAAVLAVFRAGAAYLPLDPHHPAPRLAQVLETSAAAVVLAGAGLETVARGAAETLRQRGAALPQVIDLQTLLDPVLQGVLTQGVLPQGMAPTIEAPNCAPVEASSPSSPRDLAYVIFTSGSTGVPKGAMVEQRGMINHLWAKIHQLDLGSADRLAQNASQCFDISVWQMLAPLVVGGTVVIYPDEIAHEPARLVDAVEADAVTVLETVPSVMRLMVDAVDADRGVELAALRWLVPTGEALPPELARRWQRRFPRILQVNAYGPTECSDDVSHHVVRAAVDPAAPSVPIGRPILNTRLTVVDWRFYPLPPGVPGELCVGGDGVGRGYLHNPRRTALAFVPDPFAATPGARMYRTGDWVRHLDDGVLDFLGRIDHQVKIRGFRIELGEIEAALGRQPAVAQTVVDARDDGRGGRRLVAYVVPTAASVLSEAAASEATRLDIGELRTALMQELPEYMVPAVFVPLAAMPLNRNGKVDRKALPEPDAAADDEAHGYVEPRTDIEVVVAQIFGEVVEVEPVGALDHFFHLGGHSLLATQAMARLREAFDVELPLRTLFEAPTVAELALAVEDAVMASVEGLSEDELDAFLETMPEVVS